MSRTSASVEVVNLLGVHARPASAIVTAAQGFAAEIELTKDGVTVNGKSIMGVLMLAAERGSTIEVAASGEDAALAVKTIVELVRGGFPGLDEE